MINFYLKPKFFLFALMSLIFLFGSFFVLAKDLVPPEGATTAGQFFSNIEKFTFWIVIPIVGLMIIGAGVVFITSAGMPERKVLGKKMLIYAGIGLGVVIIGVGLGELFGEKVIARVEQYEPASESMVAQTTNYIDFLDDEAASLKGEAANAQTEEEKNKLNFQADELSNLSQTLAAVTENAKKVTDDYNDTDKKYKFIAKVIKDLPDLLSKWQKASATEKIELNKQIHQDYILPLVNYGALPEKYRDVNASQAWVNILKQEEGNLKKYLNENAFPEREAAGKTAEITKEYITNPGQAVYKYGPEPAKVDPQNPTATAQTMAWDGITAPNPGQTVLANGIAFYWANPFDKWQLAKPTDISKIKATNKVEVELASKKKVTYVLQENGLIWLEKDTQKSVPNEAMLQLLEVAVRPANITPSKAPTGETAGSNSPSPGNDTPVSSGANSAFEASNQAQETGNPFYLTSNTHYTGVLDCGQQNLGPYECERLLINNAQLEGPSAAEVVRAHIDGLRNGNIPPQSANDYVLLGFKNEAEGKQWAQNNPGKTFKDWWDSEGNKRWQQNKEKFEALYTVTDPDNNIVYTNDDPYNPGNPNPTSTECTGPGCGGKENNDDLCSNGKDDDNDGWIDCEDYDCWNTQYCRTQRGENDQGDQGGGQQKPNDDSKTKAETDAAKKEQGEKPEGEDAGMETQELDLTKPLQETIMLQRTAYEFITGDKVGSDPKFAKADTGQEFSGEVSSPQAKDLLSGVNPSGGGEEGYLRGNKDGCMSLIPLAETKTAKGQDACKTLGGCSCNNCGGKPPGENKPDPDCHCKYPKLTKTFWIPLLGWNIECKDCECRCCGTADPEALCPCEKTDDKTKQPTPTSLDDLKKGDQIKLTKLGDETYTIGNVWGTLVAPKDRSYELRDDKGNVPLGMGMVSRSDLDKAGATLVTNQPTSTGPDSGQDPSTMSDAQLIETASGGDEKRDYTFDKREAIRAAHRALRSANALQKFLNAAQNCCDEAGKMGDLVDYTTAYELYGDQFNALNIPKDVENNVTTYYCCWEPGKQ